MVRPRISAGAIRLAGAALMLISLAFLAHAAAQTDLSGLFDGLAAGGLGLLTALAIGYGVTLAALAFAWWMVLDTGPGRKDLMSAVIVYGLSVVPKYLPGSVFHFASRQAFGARFGWPQRNIAAASTAEIALHLTASLSVFLAFDRILSLGQIGDGAAALIVVAIVAGMAWLLLRTPESRWRLVAALAMQLAFFSCLTLIAAGCAMLTGAGPGLALEVGALFLLSWLVGFIAPGAPGGIGVREAGLVLTVSALLGPLPTLLFAAATRVVTLVGDILFALAAFAVSRTHAFKKAGAVES